MSSSILHATPQAEKNLKKLHMIQTDTKTVYQCPESPRTCFNQDHEDGINYSTAKRAERSARETK
jgi:hypothetical protein